MAKAAAKKATTNKTQYYWAGSMYLDNVEGPFDSLSKAQESANEEGCDEFYVFTLKGKYKSKTTTTFEEVK